MRKKVGQCLVLVGSRYSGPKPKISSHLADVAWHDIIQMHCAHDINVIVNHHRFVRTLSYFEINPGSKRHTIAKQAA